MYELRIRIRLLGHVRRARGIRPLIRPNANYRSDLHEHAARTREMRTNVRSAEIATLTFVIGTSLYYDDLLTLH